MYGITLKHAATTAPAKKSAPAPRPEKKEELVKNGILTRDGWVKVLTAEREAAKNQPANKVRLGMGDHAFWADPNTYRRMSDPGFWNNPDTYRGHGR